MTSGRRTAATRVLVDGGEQALLAEVRPQGLVEDELRVCGLPEQEVRDPLLPRRPDHQIGIGKFGRVQARGHGLFGHVLGSDPFLENPARCFHELGASSVVERDPEVQAIELLRGRLELRHLLLQLGRNPVAAAEEPRAHALLREVRQLAVDGLVHQLHDRLHLVGRSRPVLGRERVHRERLDPEVDCSLDRAPERPRSFTVTLGDGKAARRRPAPVPVHDDRHASGCARILAR
jgi:hypothetical protein